MKFVILLPLDFSRLAVSPCFYVFMLNVLAELFLYSWFCNWRHGSFKKWQVQKVRLKLTTSYSTFLSIFQTTVSVTVSKNFSKFTASELHRDPRQFSETEGSCNLCKLSAQITSLFHMWLYSAETGGLAAQPSSSYHSKTNKSTLTFYLKTRQWRMWKKKGWALHYMASMVCL